MATLRKNADGSYTRTVNGKDYTVYANDSTSGRYDKIAKEYNDQQKPASNSGGSGSSNNKMSSGGGGGTDYSKLIQNAMSSGASADLVQDYYNQRSAKIAADPNLQKYANDYTAQAARDYISNQQKAAMQAQSADLLQQAMNYQYPVVEPEPYQQSILSNEEAVKLATDVLTPQYNKTYQQTAQNAAQNLERSGLYDSLYGQALAQNKENAVNQDLNSAIANMALNLRNMSKDEAMSWYNAAVSQNAQAQQANMSAKNSAMSYISNALDRLMAQAQYNQDFALQSEAQQIQNAIANEQISQVQAETALMQLQLKQAQQQAQQKTASYPIYRGGGGGIDNPSPINNNGGTSDIPLGATAQFYKQMFDNKRFGDISPAEVEERLLSYYNQGTLTDSDLIALFRYFGLDISPYIR